MGFSLRAAVESVVEAPEEAEILLGLERRIPLSRRHRLARRTPPHPRLCLLLKPLPLTTLPSLIPRLVRVAQPRASDCFLSLEVEALLHVLRRLRRSLTGCPKVGRGFACFHIILIFRVRVGHRQDKVSVSLLADPGRTKEVQSWWSWSKRVSSSLRRHKRRDFIPRLKRAGSPV